MGNIYEENKFMKTQIVKNEDHLHQITKDYGECVEKLADFFNLSAQRDKLVCDNNKMLKEAILINDFLLKNKEEVALLKKCLSEANHTVNVVEIEKEEVYMRVQYLENKLEEEIKKSSKLSKSNNEKDKEIKNLKNYTDDLSEKYNCLSGEKSYESSRKESFNSPERISFSLLGMNNNFSKITTHNYESSLSTICPDLDEEEVCQVNYNNFKITPQDVVRRLSKQDTSDMKYYEDPLNNNRLNENTKNCSTLEETSNTDIYKEFFLLTYQSFKLNTDYIDPFIYLNPEYLYSYILANNIPFHKFSHFILSEVEKIKGNKEPTVPNPSNFYSNFKKLFK